MAGLTHKVTCTVVHQLENFYSTVKMTCHMTPAGKSCKPALPPALIHTLKLHVQLL